MVTDETVSWFCWDQAVPVSQDEQERFIREIVTKLRDPQVECGDYHYIATGDALVLGFREKNGIHVKVLRPLRSADFPLVAQDGFTQGTPWCESCKSYHIVLRDQEHHRALGRFAPWKDEGP